MVDGGHAYDIPPALRRFLAPFHKPGINPTLALQNDLDPGSLGSTASVTMKRGLVNTIPPVRRSARRLKS